MHFLRSFAKSYRLALIVLKFRLFLPHKLKGIQKIEFLVPMFFYLGIQYFQNKMNGLGQSYSVSKNSSGNRLKFIQTQEGEVFCLDIFDYL